MSELNYVIEQLEEARTMLVRAYPFAEEVAKIGSKDALRWLDEFDKDNILFAMLHGTTGDAA